MVRLKVIVLGMLAALVISACASSSASAGELHWYVGGTKVSEGTSLLIMGLSTTSQVWSLVAAGVTIKFTCPHLDVHGKIDNPTGGGMGLGLATLLYLECVITPAALKCEIPGGMFTMNVSALAIGTQALPVVEFKPDNSTTFVEIEFTKCTQEALNTRFPAAGSLLGMITNSTGTIGINEVKGSSSMLSFAGAEASLTGSAEVLMEGGGKIEVKE